MFRIFFLFLISNRALVLPSEQDRRERKFNRNPPTASDANRVIIFSYDTFRCLSGRFRYVTQYQRRRKCELKLLTFSRWSHRKLCFISAVKALQKHLAGRISAFNFLIAFFPKLNMTLLFLGGVLFCRIRRAKFISTKKLANNGIDEEVLRVFLFLTHQLTGRLHS